MKRQTKKYSGILITLIISISLVGCSLGFNASAYVKACLDACTKGDVTEYAKITNISEEEAKAVHNSLIESALCSLDEYHISDERKEDFRILFQNIYGSLQYEVGEAIQNPDGSYNVPVTTKKLIVFDTVIADSQSYITDYAKAHPSVSTDELNEAILDYMYTRLSNHLNEAIYEDNDVIMIQITKTGNHQYGISEEDLSNLILSMMDSENIQ